MHFPVSGVDTPLWLPPLTAFVVSYFTSMGGLSGAFLLLPFQVSVLGFTSPAVSPTNLLFNIVAIPSGVYRYFHEGRLLWPLTALTLIGTAPGVILGGFIRIRHFPDPKRFKIFVGCVLLFMGTRLLLDLWKTRGHTRVTSSGWSARTIAFNWRRLIFEFQSRRYSCSTAGIFALALSVGMIGGIYGIGGGAIIGPFLVAMHGLPVHAIAGATLLGTFATSVIGVGFYELAARYYQSPGMAPDWLLGLLFGLGGMAGMYLGARTQRYVPAIWLKLMLGTVLLYVALRYLLGI